MKLLSTLLVFVLVACTPAAPPPPAPPPTATPVPGLQSAIEDGLGFLAGQYNPAYGLLQESPDIGQHRYYLTNDNALAAYTLGQFGSTLAPTLSDSLERYGHTDNGFVEVAWGEVIPWPPIHHKDIEVGRLTDAQCDFLNEEETEPVGDCILQETHTPDLGTFYDWSSYSNLACMGAINEYNAGYLESARRLYDMKMADFDGVGFADAVYWMDRPGVYEALGLAWCLYAGALIGEPVHQAALDMLLAQQDSGGGFHTHYTATDNRLADPNVETTSVALLALGKLGGLDKEKQGSYGVHSFPADARPNP